jgi:spore coat protein U-like protein
MRKIITATLAAGALAAGVAQALTTTTTTFPVTATVLSTCSATAASLAFPSYTPGTGTQIGNTTISVKCTKNTPFTVALNAGSGTGTFAQRLMASGGNTLQYNLYTTAAFGTVFGDGTPGSATMPGTGLGVATAAAVQVFGQLPDNATNQAAVPGSYSDLITVTVTY